MMMHKRLSVLAGLLLAGLLTAVPASWADDKVFNVNTASATELTALKGIGEAKAKAIVDYREKNGPYKTVDDLKNVRGIGDKMLDTLRPQLSVTTTAAAAPVAANKH